MLKVFSSDNQIYFAQVTFVEKPQIENDPF